MNRLAAWTECVKDFTGASLRQLLASEDTVFSVQRFFSKKAVQFLAVLFFPSRTPSPCCKGEEQPRLSALEGQENRFQVRISVVQLLGGSERTQRATYHTSSPDIIEKKRAGRPRVSRDEPRMEQVFINVLCAQNTMWPLHSSEEM